MADWIREAAQAWFDKDSRSSFCERFELLLESEALFEGLPPAVRYGRTLEHILARVSLPIRPHEKLLGAVREAIPTDEQRRRVEEASRRWWDIPAEEIQQQILWYYSHGWVRRRPPWFFSLGHLALDWEALVRGGLGSFQDRAEQAARQPAVRGDAAKEQFLEGALLCLRALSAYIRRYGEEAAAAADTCPDTGRRAELLAMAGSLRHLAEGPARSLREALQLLWLVILPLMKVAGCGVFNLHRMDQYLLAFYRRDLESGALTREAALELVEEFFQKNNEIMSPADHMSEETEASASTLEVTYDDPNYLVVGGLLPDGSPGVNDLSFLFVEATHRLGLRNPFLVVRWYPGIDAAFWRAACAAMRDNATVVVYSDSTMIPALRRYGVDGDDAADYGLHGCNDPNMGAREGGLRQLWFNLARPLELALHGGRYPLEPEGTRPATGTQWKLDDRLRGWLLGPYHGVATPPPGRIGSVDELLEAYRLQVRAMMEDFRRGFEEDLRVERRVNAGRLRIEDCFLRGTLEAAESWNDGGTTYHKVTMKVGGLATVADSLAAVEQLVFRDREMSLEALAATLRNDFAGQERLALRLARRMPKYGNDIAWVDGLARRVVEIFTEEVERVNGPRYLYAFWPTLSTDRAFPLLGRDVGATPDGRRARHPLSENQSPNEGADMSGLTALLSSAARLPCDRIAGGPLNIRIHPSAVAGRGGLDRFCALLSAFFARGGMQVQVNVVGKEQLLEAQRDPQRHRSLCVRVTGYSAYFVQMGRQAQDEMIRRTEQR